MRFLPHNPRGNPVVLMARLSSYRPTTKDSFPVKELSDCSFVKENGDDTDCYKGISRESAHTVSREASCLVMTPSTTPGRLSARP